MLIYLGTLGTVSILTILVIGWDRYNTIVKGFSGTKVTKGKAVGILIVIWTYSTLLSGAPLLGWGNYALEGQLMTCSYDYMSLTTNDQSFCYFAFVFHFVIPVGMCAFFYGSIVSAVVKHEMALRAQAKKMNVESLRSGDQVLQS